MDLYQILETIGKITLGVGCFGLVAWIIKLLTQVNKNQKEYISLLEKEFQEREKTREQRIASMIDIHKQEVNLLERKHELLVASIELEKRTIEQRYEMRVGKDTKIPNYSTTGLTSLALDKLDDKEEWKRLSDYLSHNIKQILIPILQQVSELREIGKPDATRIEHLYDYIHDLNEQSNLLTIFSGETLTKNTQIDLMEVFKKVDTTITRGALKMVFSPPGITRVMVLAEEAMLYYALSETLENARIHGADSKVYVTITRDSGLVRVEIKNVASSCVPDLAPMRGYGLLMLRKTIEAMQGEMSYEAREEDGQPFFAVKVSLVAAASPDSSNSDAHSSGKVHDE